MPVSSKVETLDHSTPVDRIGEIVDRIKECPTDQAYALVHLLSERHPVYRERSSGEAIRMRGYAMAAFECTGLPNRALPYILEVLESDFHPYLVAAAARSLRGMERPHPQIPPFLIKAIYNIWQGDNPVSFDSFRVEWPLEEYSTALTEIFETLCYFGNYAQNILPELEHLNQFSADKFSESGREHLARAIEAIRKDEREVDMGCCELPHLLQSAEESIDSGCIRDIPGDLSIQDQDGNYMGWGEFFSQKPTVLAFFYTRCENPRKCTRTIFNLAAIRQLLEDAHLATEVRVAAITYDPKFDTPEALKSYGDARRFVFDENSKMLRLPAGFDHVLQAFSLGVNFTGSQVNSHRVELFLLNSEGRIARSFLRLQSEPSQVVDAIGPLLSSPPATEHQGRPKSPSISSFRERLHSASSLGLGFLMVFFPKCPMCWASYMSLLGVAGAESIPYSPWLRLVIVVVLSVNLYFLFRGASARNGYSPFLLSLSGSIFLILSNAQIGLPRWTIALGLSLLIAGSLLQSLNFRHFNKLRLFFSEFLFRLVRQRSFNSRVSLTGGTGGPDRY